MSHHRQQSREVNALSATGQLGMAAIGQIQLTVVSRGIALDDRRRTLALSAATYERAFAAPLVRAPCGAAAPLRVLPLCVAAAPVRAWGGRLPQVSARRCASPGQELSSK